MAPAEAVDLSGPWRLNPQVSLRSEQFGGLAYHFGTRRLSFLKSRELFDVVATIEQYPSPLDACVANGVEDRQLPRFIQALCDLARTGMIVINDAG